MEWSDWACSLICSPSVCLLLVFWGCKRRAWSLCCAFVLYQLKLFYVIPCTILETVIYRVIYFVSNFWSSLTVCKRCLWPSRCFFFSFPARIYDLAIAIITNLVKRDTKFKCKVNASEGGTHTAWFPRRGRGMTESGWGTRAIRDSSSQQLDSRLNNFRSQSLNKATVWAPWKVAF